MQHERRRYPRLQRSIRLTLQRRRLLFLPGRKSAAEIVDVSRSGARLNTLVDLVKNDRIVLVLRARSLRPALAFKARVVWARRVSGAQGPYVQAGVRFLAVPVEQAGLLFRLAVGHMEE